MNIVCNIATWLGVKPTLDTNAAAIWTSIQSQIGNKVGVASTWGMNIVGNIATQLGIKSTVETGAAGIWTAVLTNIGYKTSEAANWGRDVVNFFRNAISDPERLAAFATYVKDLPNKLLSTIRNVLGWNNGTGRFEALVGFGADVIYGFWKGISDNIGWIMTNFERFFQNIKDTIDNIFDRDSPSKWMAGLGRDLMKGLAIGVTAEMPTTERAMASAANQIVQTTNNNFYLSYQTMRSAENVQQDIQLLNLLYGGQIA
jgi:hypothetical protein